MLCQRPASSTFPQTIPTTATAGPTETYKVKASQISRTNKQPLLQHIWANQALEHKVMMKLMSCWWKIGLEVSEFHLLPGSGGGE
ncbi:hypothetical protein LEMLEM_LOCUS27211 [Lemmus lemmus]